MQAEGRGMLSGLRRIGPQEKERKGPAPTLYAKAAKKGRDTGRIEKPKEKRLSPPPKKGHRVII
jgi:hypothetical protein